MDIGPWRFNVQSKDDALEFLMNLDVTFTSPYARLARILVLEDRVEIVAAKTRVADTFGRVWELDDAKSGNGSGMPLRYRALPSEID